MPYSKSDLLFMTSASWSLMRRWAMMLSVCQKGNRMQALWSLMIWISFLYSLFDASQNENLQKYQFRISVMCGLEWWVKQIGDVVLEVVAMIKVSDDGVGGWIKAMTVGLWGYEWEWVRREMNNKNLETWHKRRKRRMMSLFFVFDIMQLN